MKIYSGYWPDWAIKSRSHWLSVSQVVLSLAVKTMNASVSSTFWFIFENSPMVQFNTTRSQSHAQPQNGLCLFMCSAAKAGERALPTKRTGNGKRRILRKSNRLQEVKSNKRKRSAYNWKRKWEGRTLINYNKREEITVEPHKYKDTGYHDIVLLWSNC